MCAAQERKCGSPSCRSICLGSKHGMWFQQGLGCCQPPACCLPLLHFLHTESQVSAHGQPSKLVICETLYQASTCICPACKGLCSTAQHCQYPQSSKGRQHMLEYMDKTPTLQKIIRPANQPTARDTNIPDKAAY